MYGIVGRSQPPVGLFFSVYDSALLQEKKKQRLEFSRSMQGSRLSEAFFFLSSFGRIVRKIFHFVSIYLCFTGRVLRVRCRVNTGMSPLLFCLTDGVCRLISWGNCDDGIDCYDVQHISSRQPRWNLLIALS